MQHNTRRADWSQHTGTSEESDKWLGRLTAARVFGVVVFFWAVAAVLNLSIGALADRASFGDSFGWLNALFSGLAFGGVIYAILLQRRELWLQREELEAARKELRRSADAQERSEKALMQQAFLLQAAAEISALTAVISSCSSQIEVYMQEGRTGSRPRAAEAEILRVERDKHIARLREITTSLKKEPATAQHGAAEDAAPVSAGGGAW